MARGLTYRWKMPIAYFATNQMVDSAIVARLITKCVTACQTSGLKIRAVVCDQSSVNRKAAKILNISAANPHFLVNEEKVFFIFDFPHVIKCIRNNLMKRKGGCFVGQIAFSKTSTTVVSLKLLYRLINIKYNTKYNNKYNIKYPSKCYGGGVAEASGGTR